MSFLHHYILLDLSAKFSKTPPPSPVDLIMKERAKSEDNATEKQTGLQPKGILLHIYCVCYYYQ